MCTNPECQRPEGYTGESRTHYYVDPKTGETKSFVFWPSYDDRQRAWIWPSIHVYNGVVTMSSHPYYW